MKWTTLIISLCLLSKTVLVKMSFSYGVNLKSQKQKYTKQNNAKKRNPQISKGMSLINSLITVLKVWSYFLENDQTFETVSELRSDMWLNEKFFFLYFLLTFSKNFCCLADSKEQ